MAQLLGCFEQGLVVCPINTRLPRHGVSEAIFNAGCKAVIVDDYLKITIAERHFQDEQPLEEVAAFLKIPVDRVEAAKESMLREVQKASLEVYRKQSSNAGFNMESVGGEESWEKDN